MPSLSISPFGLNGVGATGQQPLKSLLAILISSNMKLDNN
jgi:hypothetical protein